MPKVQAPLRCSRDRPEGPRRDGLHGGERHVAAQRAHGKSQVGANGERGQRWAFSAEVVDGRELQAAHAPVAARTVDQPERQPGAHLRVGQHAILEFGLHDVAPRARDVGVECEGRQHLEGMAVGDEGILCPYRPPVIEVAIVGLGPGWIRHASEPKQRAECNCSSSHGSPVQDGPLWCHCPCRAGDEKMADFRSQAARNTCRLHNLGRFATLLRFALVREQLWPDSSKRTWDHPRSSVCV